VVRTDGASLSPQAWVGIVSACAIAGVLLLHPLTMVIYWFEFHPAHAASGTVANFVLERMVGVFQRRMVGMTGIFAALGVLLGLPAVVLTRAFTVRGDRIRSLELELNRGIPDLIAAGESEILEFKSSARWDRNTGKVSRAVEAAIVRTVAALMNHRGGSLLIGVSDNGEIVGIEEDLATLRRRDRDGFEAYLVGLLAHSLGAAVLRHVHVAFSRLEGKELCRVVVQRGRGPVYVMDGSTARYFVRTGNTSRELDAREAVLHTAGRQTEPES